MTFKTELLLNGKIEGSRFWHLSGDYLGYRKGGGNLTPLAWNKKVNELRKESVMHK